MYTASYQCTFSVVQCMFSVLIIPSSLRPVLYCRFPETTLNAHSTLVGGGDRVGGTVPAEQSYPTVYETKLKLRLELSFNSVQS